MNSCTDDKNAKIKDLIASIHGQIEGMHKKVDKAIERRRKSRDRFANTMLVLCAIAFLVGLLLK